MNIGFVLSGGGAKGSFQIGAIKFLYKLGIHPKIVIGTSVGSINAAKLAEGEGIQDGIHTGFEALEQIWLGLVKNEDMYIPEPTLSAIIGAPEILKEAIEHSILVNNILPGIGFFYSKWIFEGDDDSVADRIRNIIKAFQNSHGVYSLSPIENRLLGNHPYEKDKLNFKSIKDSKIRLLVSIVGLNTGKLRYVNEDGQVFDSHNLSVPIADSVSLIDAIMSSATMPGIFIPKTILGEMQVDGGVREIVPVQVALDLGADEIYAIICSSKVKDQEEKEHNQIHTLALRSIDIMTDEIISGDLSTNNISSTFIIRPNFEVHDTITIDPGLIRINIAYGYMRSFDVVGGPMIYPIKRAYITRLTDEIINLRKEILEKERFAFKWFWKRLEVPRSFGEREVPSTLEYRSDLIKYDLDLIGQAFVNIKEIRFMKCTLKSKIETRVRLAGSLSMPDDYNQWWLGWEKHTASFSEIDEDGDEHSEIREAIPPTPDPWSKFTIDMWVPYLEVFREEKSLSHLYKDKVLSVEAEIPCPDSKPEEIFSIETYSHHSGGLIQSDWGKIGNFELLVPHGNTIKHYWRDNDSPSLPWQKRSDLPPALTSTNTETLNSDASISPRYRDLVIDSTMTPAKSSEPARDTPFTGVEFSLIYRIPSTPLGVSAIQSNLGFSRGIFYAIVHLKAPNGEEYLAEYYYDVGWPTWKGPFPILVDGKKINGITGF